MSKGKEKANAQGWVRNRGRSALCPCEPSQVIEVRDRDGDIYEVEASALRWHHIGNCGDIMAWRHISDDQQALEKAFDACVEKCASTEPGHVEMPATTTIDGPLQWRDRITEIDRAIEALEEERVSLVQRLADEGLQLIDGSMPDMSNPDNWKAGDLVVSLKESDSSYFKAGGIYVLRDDCENNHVKVKHDEAGQENGWSAHNFKWHSSQSK